MQSWGPPGNLRYPHVSLRREKGMRISGQRTKSRRRSGSPAVLTSLLKGGDTDIKEGQSRVSGEDGEERTNLRGTCGSPSGS
ncbi:hypothetical protein [Desulfonema magnum]|uniref:Uncharacterized protein n=1 Tax=Desulfonema magnum TaxID=45655 RepID=A0A975BTZ2_9BACT|nr:hypothetical protein [Desulfonema magnum]QTA91701.1 Uncharacterized protein dnm_077750 [Desulfonema magnum]